MSLPVIDISSLCKDLNANVDESSVKNTIDQIHMASKEYGFFYISGHGVEQSDFQELFDCAGRFFALPKATKNGVSMQNNRSFRGYVETNSEQTAGGLDQRESMYFISEIISEDSDGWKMNPSDKNTMACKNQFPDENDVPGFEETITRLSKKLEELGFIMMRAVTESLKLTAKERFYEQFSDPITTLILLHYPVPALPQPDEKNKWGIGPHTDYGLFIFLLQDEVGGLEVEVTEGEWISITPKPGTIIVNFGDCLQAWTKGLYRATKHRVRRSTEKDRYSVAYFFDPKPGCLIEPLEIEMTKDLTFNKTIKGMKMPFRFWDYFKFLNKINYYWKDE